MGLTSLEYLAPNGARCCRVAQRFFAAWLEPVRARLCRLPIGSARHLKKSACRVSSPVAELGRHTNRRVGEKGVTSSKPGGSHLRRGRKRRVPSPPAELAACAQHCSQACLQRFTGHNLLSSKPMANSVLSAADAK